MGIKTYWLWKEGPWDLPNPVKPKSPAASQTPQSLVKLGQPMVSTDAIVSKNLFDPERGASKTKEAEAETQAMQRIRSMVLLGTAILGPSRYAVVQESNGLPMGPTAPGRLQTPRRLKVGDMIDGFNLSEISEKKIVFIKGAARVEVPVDFFRKVELSGPPGPVPPGLPPPQVGTGISGPPVPPVVPNIARKPRLPAPPPNP